MTDSEEPNDAQAFASDVPLTDVFGSHPKTRILATLLGETTDPVTHFTVNEIARISGADHETIEDHIVDLLAYGVVVETDDLEDQRTYTLNEERDVVEDLRRLHTDLFEAIPESSSDR